MGISTYEVYRVRGRFVEKARFVPELATANSDEFGFGLRRRCDFVTCALSVFASIVYLCRKKDFITCVFVEDILLHQITQPDVPQPGKGVSDSVQPCSASVRGRGCGPSPVSHQSQGLRYGSCPCIYSSILKPTYIYFMG